MPLYDRCQYLEWYSIDCIASINARARRRCLVNLVVCLIDFSSYNRIHIFRFGFTWHSRLKWNMCIDEFSIYLFITLVCMMSLLTSTLQPIPCTASRKWTNQRNDMCLSHIKPNNGCDYGHNRKWPRASRSSSTWDSNNKTKKNYSYCSRSTYSIPNTYISIIAYFYWLFRCCCCRCCCSVCLLYCFTHSTRCHCHTAHSTSCKYQTFRLRLCSVPHELIFHFIYSFQLDWSKHR